MCLVNENGLLCICMNYGIVVILNVDYVRDQFILIFIFDGEYDFFEDIVINFVMFDKFVCDYNLFFRNVFVEIVLMIIVIEMIQRMEDIVLNIYGIVNFLYGVVWNLIGVFVIVLCQFSYLSLLFDIRGIFCVYLISSLEVLNRL